MSQYDCSSLQPTHKFAKGFGFGCSFLEKSRCVSKRAVNRLKNHVKSMVGKLRSAFAYQKRKGAAVALRLLWNARLSLGGVSLGQRGPA